MSIGGNGSTGRHGIHTLVHRRRYWESADNYRRGDICASSVWEGWMCTKNPRDSTTTKTPDLEMNWETQCTRGQWPDHVEKQRSDLQPTAEPSELHSKARQLAGTHNWWPPQLSSCFQHRINRGRPHLTSHPGYPFFWQPCPAPTGSPAPIRHPEPPSAPLGSSCSPPPASEPLPSTSSASSEQTAFPFSIPAWFQRTKDLNRHFYQKDTEMANWNVKIWSTPLVIKEMQIKTTTGYCFTTSRVVTEIKKKEKR